jgi:hypothetical protein
MLGEWVLRENRMFNGIWNILKTAQEYRYYSHPMGKPIQFANRKEQHFKVTGENYASFTGILDDPECCKATNHTEFIGGFNGNILIYLLILGRY